jgi:chorismate synthase
MANTFGKLFRLTTFGESHAKMIGGIIDGCPAGIPIDINYVQLQLDRRKPGSAAFLSNRKEEDHVEFVSGIFEQTTLGTPIAFLISNKDAKSEDYDILKDVFRPSHADFTYQRKYGIRDHRGGGRASARETANWVVAGSIAEQWLARKGIKIYAYVSQIGSVKSVKHYNYLNMNEIYQNDLRCPDSDARPYMERLLQDVLQQGDTTGGIITCIIQNVPVGLGEPVFDKLQADLGKAMLGINAVKGVAFGSGFEAASMLGSEHNDEWTVKDDEIKTKTNHSGGIQGGISNGMDIYFRIAFKPIATLMKGQTGINSQAKRVPIPGKGRHDVCAVPRAVPVVQALSAMVIIDHYLLQYGHAL